MTNVVENVFLAEATIEKHLQSVKDILHEPTRDYERVDRHQKHVCM